MQHADGGHGVAVFERALLHIQSQFGQRGGRVGAPVHGRGAGVAGGADDLALHAHAAVDGSDDAQRHVQLVEHRALLNVHFNKAQVVGWLALQLGYVVNVQAGVLHGLAHGDAVGVFLIQPFRLEVADQRARAQKSGLVALAFFFGKGHHFKVKRQALSLAVQLTNASHGSEDAQPSVVLAAVAHGVVVRAGHQGFGVWRGGAVNADHIAHGVNRHVVKAAVAHAVHDVLRAGAVCVGQVGDGELTFVGVARVAEGAELFLPVPKLVAQHRLVAKLVVEPDLGNAVDVAQALLPFKLRVAQQAPRKGFNDLLLVQPQSTRATHRQNEGKAELGVVVGVELLDHRKLCRRALRQTRLALLVGGLGRQALADHGLAGQLGVRLDQFDLSFFAGRLKHAGQLHFQVGQ